ncbi:MAG: isoprenylcysteine carboxylmethyltransferase family protein [Acidobacteriota bacterium]|nr:isoprenylcysteine carboxylmethyltransferase family protein [Acidobacteriota bacterium]
MKAAIERQPRYWFPKPYADFVQRLRVVGGFVLLLAFAWLAQPSVLSLAIGLPVSFLGLMLRAWAAGHLAKDRELATDGPYAYIRNPLYVGTLTVAFGIVISAQNIWLAGLFAIVFLLVYLPAVELEEQHLRDIFPQYGAYAAQVNRFLPVRKFFGGGAPFSWQLYRTNEEFKAALGWVLAAAWLIWCCWLVRTLR